MTQTPSQDDQLPAKHLALPFLASETGLGLEGSLRLLIKAVEQSPVSVIITDTRGVIEYVNPKFTHLMGFSSAEAIGKTPRIIKGGYLPREFYQEMWRTIQAGQEWHGVFHNRTKSGALVWEVASISPIRDDHGAITHFVGVKEDITELKNLQEQVDHMARHDQLTGLPNRFFFNDRAQQALAQARRRNSKFALLYMDLNEFKKVNDNLGHEAGDKVLAAIGQRLSLHIRETDTLARMGGDEFTVLLTDVEGEDSAERVATMLIELIQESVHVRPGQEAKVGLAIGIALYPQDGQTIDELTTHADRAMYQVKRQGRTGYQFASRMAEGL